MAIINGVVEFIISTYCHLQMKRIVKVGMGMGLSKYTWKKEDNAL
jgi:hypothetical protein